LKKKFEKVRKKEHIEGKKEKGEEESCCSVVERERRTDPILNSICVCDVAGKQKYNPLLPLLSIGLYDSINDRRAPLC
jgi:hypothetical protein